MLILTDNDVVGTVRAFRRILESEEWAELTPILDLQFIEFPDVELPRDASDVTVWQRCQEVGALLITGNRSSGTDSLEQTIHEQGRSDSFPVLTISDPQRVTRNSALRAYRMRIRAEYAIRGSLEGDPRSIKTLNTA
jgi:hypothetical protein